MRSLKRGFTLIELIVG
ncbi:MAG: prepilin-type N-terminal cleavage/methylation domain-containing protein, partial [Aeromonas veronii]